MGLLSRAEEIRYVDRLGKEMLEAFSKADDVVHEAIVGKAPTRFYGLPVKISWCEVPEMSESEAKSIREMGIAIRDGMRVPSTLLGGRCGGGIIE